MKLAHLLLLLLLVSCNQNGLGVGGAVSNFFTAPFKGVSSIFTDNQYEEERQKTKEEQAKKENSQGDLQYCLDQSGQPIDADHLSEMDKLKQKIRTVACRCLPWGNCPTNVCSCSIQCPQGFDIFKHPAELTPKNLSDEKNGLAFRNSSIPSQYEQTQGYCWGHARTTSQFNRLAFFRPEQKPPFDINSTNSNEQDKAIDYYKELIDRVGRNEATNIPGFPDLKSLSEHPALQSYIADNVAKTWAKHAMSWQGLSLGLGSGQQSTEYYQKFFKDVKERIDMNMQPTVVFTGRGSSFYTHAALISHYETLPNGQIKICMRDNNVAESRARDCQDNMMIHPTKGLIYSNPMWGEIGTIKLAHNENSDATEQAASLRSKCKAERGCQNQ